LGANIGSVSADTPRVSPGPANIFTGLSNKAIPATRVKSFFMVKFEFCAVKIQNIIS
jgi:hypothetical protein